MAPAGPPTYLFGPFRLEAGERRLLRDGQPVPLTPKAFQTLLVLLENAGRLVPKELLMERVWPGTFVAEVTLAQNVSLLRKALGRDEAGDLIETVAKAGYRLLGEVRIAQAEPPAAGPASTIPDAAAMPAPSGEGLAASRRRRTRWLWAVPLAIAAAAVVAAAALWLGRDRSAVVKPAPGEVRSLAVLPFRFLGAQPDKAVFELGLAESVIARLSRVPILTVRPLRAVAPFAESRLEASEIGRTLRVDAVLEGSLQRDGSAVRVTAYLRRVADGKTLWSGHVSDVSANMLAAEESLSAQLVARLWPAVEVKPAGASRPVDPVAYELYLRGRYFWSKRSRDSLIKAVDAFQQAVERDPGMAVAFASLADARMLLADSTSDPNAELLLAKQALDKAVALDEGLAEAHSVKALYLSNRDYDWEGAKREYRRAIELAPGDVTPTHRLGELLGLLGSFDEGLALLARAQRMDPLSLIVGADTAKVLLVAERYPEAVREARRVLELDPGFAQAHLYLSFGLVLNGDRKAALEEVARYLSVEATLTPRCMAGWVYAMANERDRAEAVLREATAASARGDYVAPYYIACIHAALGRKTEALDWLERAYRERGTLLGFHVNPVFRPLRSEPRFQALCRKLHLPVQGSGTVK